MERGRVLALLAGVTMLWAVSAQPAQALDPVASFGDNPAELAMFVYVPPDLPAGPRPLVVALHGCTQTAADYVDAGWNDLADEWGFYVVYPEQNRSRNNQWGCFNWGGSWDGAPNPWVAGSTPLHVGDLERGQSENRSIVSMVEHMKGTYEVDDTRVYVTGLSAGGGMAAVMLATWPDVFAGGAIFAGVPHACATERAIQSEATACLGDMTGSNAYLDRDPAGWGDLVRNAHPSWAGPYPRVSIWHGSLDFTVKPKTSEELAEQWTNVHGIEAVPTESEMVEGADRAVYRRADGVAVVETWMIGGMGHGAPVDPASGCGATGSWINDAGICGARQAGLFFGLDGAADAGGGGGPVGDPDGPAVTITSPTTGAVVDGMVTVTVEATDPDGVARVELYVDDVLQEMIDAPPYTFDWDSTGSADGARRLSAVALDSTDAMGVGRAQVIVSNGGGGTGGGGTGGGGTAGGGGTGGGGTGGGGGTVGGDADGAGSYLAGCSVTSTPTHAPLWLLLLPLLLARRGARGRFSPTKLLRRARRTQGD